jgi:WD repeat-containing protein 92
LRIYELDQGKLNTIVKLEKKHGLKCCTFGASPSATAGRKLAVGDYGGKLSIYDVDGGQVEKPIWEVVGVQDNNFFALKVEAHSKIVNCIDGCGGLGIGGGACEIVTGSRDGSVKVWDPRTNEPVVVLEPMESNESHFAQAFFIQAEMLLLIVGQFALVIVTIMKKDVLLPVMIMVMSNFSI